MEIFEDRGVEILVPGARCREVAAVTEDLHLLPLRPHHRHWHRKGRWVEVAVDPWVGQLLRDTCNAARHVISVKHRWQHVGTDVRREARAYASDTINGPSAYKGFKSTSPL